MKNKFPQLSWGMVIAVYLMTLVFGYVFAITFADIPKTGIDHAKTALPFLLGSVLGIIIGYYYGNSSKKNQGEPEGEMTPITETNQPLVAPPEDA